MKQQDRDYKDHIEESKLKLALECYNADLVNSGLTWHRKITYFKANVKHVWVKL